MDDWSAGIRGFGVRIVRANQNAGDVRRVHLVRCTDADGKDREEVLGTLVGLSCFDVKQNAEDMRERVRVRKLLGAVEVPTLGGAFDDYLRRRPTLSPVTVQTYRGPFRDLETMKDRLLRSFTRQEWTDLHLALRAPKGVDPKRPHSSAWTSVVAVLAPAGESTHCDSDRGADPREMPLR